LRSGRTVEPAVDPVVGADSCGARGAAGAVSEDKQVDVGAAYVGDRHSAGRAEVVAEVQGAGGGTDRDGQDDRQRGVRVGSEPAAEAVGIGCGTDAAAGPKALAPSRTMTVPGR
jgi:hypothetical protein